MQEATEDLRSPGEIASALRASFDMLEQTLAELEPARREQAGTDGAWSPKVELAHIAFWDEFQRVRMEAALTGRSRAGIEWPSHDNDARAQADAHRDWEEVVEAARAARARLIDFALGVDPAVLDEEFPEGERMLSVGRQLRHMIRHVEMHTTAIRAHHIAAD